MLEITSTANQRIKEIRALANRKTRTETGLAYIEGLRIAIEAYEDNVVFEYLIVCDSLLKSPSGRALVDKFISDYNEKVIHVNESVFRHISGKDGPQGLAAVVRQRWSTLDEIDVNKSGTIVALVEPADPGNLGTILRTADAAGVKSILLLDNSTDPYDLASIRASMGAVFNLQLIKCTMDEFSNWKENQHLQVFGASDSAEENFHTTYYPSSLVLLMGSEREGLSSEHIEMCDKMVSIPMLGKSDSLNLAMATGIILYEILNHRQDQNKLTGENNDRNNSG